jgi:hypothetical protein
MTARKVTSELRLDLDELVKSARRGERTNPCPNSKYHIAARKGDYCAPLPIPFNSPEEAVLMLIQLSPLLPDNLTFDVVAIEAPYDRHPNHLEG